MHVFLDTNILETDPFWKGTHLQAILEMAKNRKLFLHMSTIVYEELKRHTTKNYKKQHKEYTASVYAMNQYVLKNSAPLPVADPTKDFIDFYQQLQNEYHLKILPYKADYLSKVIDRAINKKKPFNDQKTEVKDCVIWLTYAEYANSLPPNSCFLLCANTTDFYTSVKPTKEPLERNIHEELAADSSRFRCFVSARDFIKLVIEPQQQATARFKEWLSGINVNEKYIFDLVIKDQRRVEAEISRIVEHRLFDRIFNKSEWYSDGYCVLSDVEWIKCTELQLDMLETSCIVTAVIVLDISVEGYAYNPVREDNEDHYQYVGETNIAASVTVTLILQENNQTDSFDIDHIEYHFD